MLWDHLLVGGKSENMLGQLLQLLPLACCVCVPSRGVLKPSVRFILS